MATATEWEEIAMACEKATGPDREIDLRIWRALDRGRAGASWDERNFVQLTSPLPDAIASPRYTSSIDAIAAAIGAMPGWRWRAGTGNVGDHPWGSVHIPPRGDISRTLAATPALALCAAFARAMAERME